MPVWIGVDDAPFLRSGKAPVPPGNRIASLFGPVAGSPKVEPERELSEGDEVGHGFVVLDTPGHSPGHVSFWREADRTLICGDVFFNLNIVTFAYGLRQPPEAGPGEGLVDNHGAVHEALEDQAAPEHAGDALVIFHDQDVLGHGPTFHPPSPPCLARGFRRSLCPTHHLRNRSAYRPVSGEAPPTAPPPSSLPTMTSSKQVPSHAA